MEGPASAEVCRGELIPADTTADAFRAQIEAIRRMSPAQRSEQVSRLNEHIRTLAAAGVRHRHPDYDEDQVRLAVIRLSLGDELFRAAYPGVDIQP